MIVIITKKRLQELKKIEKDFENKDLEVQFLRHINRKMSDYIMGKKNDSNNNQEKTNNPQRRNQDIET